MNVVVPGAAIGDLTLDGTIVASSNFTQVGTSGIYSASLPVAAGAHTLATPNTGLGFGSWAYGYGSLSVGNSGYDGYAYPTTVMLPVTPGFVWVPPIAPTTLSATASSASAINLAWVDNSSDERGFRIERKGGANPAWTAIGSVLASVTSFADSGLLKATAYTYRVRAFNDLDSDWSNEASATTFDTPPNPPSSISATPVNSTQVNVNWTDSSNNETGFKIERKIGTAGTYAQVGTVGAGVTTFPDSGLTKLTLYVYRVRAYNSFGDGAYSPEAQVTTTDDPPAAPSMLTAVGTAWNQVNLAWTDNSNNETGFKVERSSDGVSYSQIGAAAANAVGYVDFTVTGSSTYYYRVRATNAGGDSGYSNVATVTTPNPPVPTAPTNLVATALNSSQIRLDWTDTSNCEAGFRVERLVGSVWTFMANVGANVVTYTDGGLTAQTTYTYRVYAYNITGSSAWTNLASAVTASDALVVGPPGEPKICYTCAADATSINVYWTPSAGALGYRVYRGTVQGGPKILVGSLPPSNGNQRIQVFVNSGLTAGTYYFFSVSTMNAGGESIQSPEDSETPDGATMPINGSISQILGWALSQSIPGIDMPPVYPENTLVLLPDGTAISGSGTQLAYDPSGIQLVDNQATPKKSDERGGGQLTMFSSLESTFAAATMNPTVISYSQQALSNIANLNYNSNADSIFHYKQVSASEARFVPDNSLVRLEGQNMYVGFASWPGVIPGTWSLRYPNTNIEIGMQLTHYGSFGVGLPLRFVPYARSEITGTMNNPRYILKMGKSTLNNSYIRADSGWNNLGQNQIDMFANLIGNGRYAVGEVHGELSGSQGRVLGYFYRRPLGNLLNHTYAKVAVGVDQTFTPGSDTGPSWLPEPAAKDNYFKTGHFKTYTNSKVFLPSFRRSLDDSAGYFNFLDWQIHTTSYCTFLRELGLPTLRITNN